MAVHPYDGQDEAILQCGTRRRWRRLVQFPRDQGGATAVEFTLVAIPFFALIFAIIELALMFWTGQELETAVSQVSRRLLTGEARQRYTSPDPKKNTDKFKQDICGAASLLVDCAKLTIDVRTYGSFANADTGTAGSSPLQGGTLNTEGFGFTQPTGGQIVVVRAVLAYPVIFAGWSNVLANINGTSERALTASTAFRTEPFQ
ncbi:pilus assembly protein [Bosea caraganae]|uniref:Pilus assembly protein n=1 Tax=Bosea caraganae TaxID=2763117 RepID=A0A370L9F1_9HYPH|nr:TadE/TadG family type IV pilus assembly protein [Bosea caraganae]RDJ26876.1 pilus assembly protein [Bosea caraganae]RDJ30764.1 pilus assembly protein [Bosea caraganae]